MEKTIQRAIVRGTVTAPPSKSYAQRAIAAALLCEEESSLCNMELCNDTRAALNVAQDLGAKVTMLDASCSIQGGIHPRSHLLHVGESGLATRLFTPIAALCNEEITITGSGSILQRPISMMEDPLRELGVKIGSRGGFLPLRIQGPIHGGKVWADGSQSSQFITGLLMALPLAHEDTILSVNNLRSRPYIDMTLELLEHFGIDVQHNDYEQFYIKGGQRYMPTRYAIEGDWSSASCMLVAGAIAGEVTVENLNPLSIQADTAMIDALTRAGAEIITTPRSVTVRHHDLNGFEFDATQCPDLFPALAALAANCKGTSLLYGTERLIHKESNRAQTLCDLFNTLGIKTQIESANVMQITGGTARPAVANSYNDHRIAMAAAIAALTCEGNITILGAEAVNKSYPEFWNDFDSLIGAPQ